MSETHDTAGFIAPEPAQLAPMFPGYEVQGLIATGGMGAVYRAVQKSLDRTVALKILPMEFSSDAAFCAGFEAEAKAMARLNHPNLIGVFDFGEVGGMLYIIMEHVAGQSLYHATYGHAVEPSEVVRLVTAICNGLAHAHEYGIIHRDIKPSNILLDLNLQPKIGDFGLARPAERKIEEGEEIFGTPHYTAPEVVNAPQSVDYRADIFSVGVLLHELLTAQLPANDPRPASTIVRCDTRFDTIIRRATQPLPAARYSSAAEMARDLQAIGTSLTKKTAHPAVTAGPRRTSAARAHATRQKSSGNGMVVFMGLLVAGAVLFAYLHFSKTPPPTTPVPKIVVVPAKVSPPVVTPPNTNGKPTVEPVTDPAPGATVPSSPDTTATTVDPDEAPATIPDPDPTAPGEESTPAAVPKFDVPAFLVRARGIMKEKAQTQLSVYQSSLRGNLTNYKRDLMREIGKVKSGSAEMSATLQTETAAWDKAGGRIPAEAPSSLSDVPGIEGIHSAYVLRQSGLKDTFQQALAPLSALYVTGLEKQIERLQADSDAGAVALVKEEIKETRSNLAHFPNLMLGTAAEEDE